MVSLGAGDLAALLLIILVSYLITFRTGLIDLLIPKKKRELKGRRHRGTISGEETKERSGSIFKRVK